ncbi:MAG: response regulator, partial [Massilia sp.]|nr:response regulator [Massilia sp.]
MNELEGLSALIIEPHAGMRASIHNMLTLCGLSKVDHAGSSNNAIRHLGLKTFDLILCEYDLDGGQDGQQLLEDLRHHKLITLSTMFFMVTAEGNYSKVVSAAELAPTDYVLKPFTIEVLSRRIEKALDRRAALHEVHTLADDGNLREALRLCAAGEAAGARHAVDFARLRAELHVQLGELDAAATQYRAILAQHPRGWASLGLARTLVAQQRHAEAASLLDELMTDNPRLMAAYDLLA